MTEFASTTIPETIPAEGGAYTMTFTTRTETRSQPVVPVFEPWQYRVTLGEAVGDAIAVTEPKTEVSVVIGSNYSKEPRAVVVKWQQRMPLLPLVDSDNELNRSLPWKTTCNRIRPHDHSGNGSLQRRRQTRFHHEHETRAPIRFSSNGSTA
ncbi:MAG: hypothetical protein ACLUEV_12265 [Alistipes sp.]